MKLNDVVFMEINREDARDILLNYHYLQRMPPISIVFGAYYEDELIGVLTYGKPPSNSLCVGIAGENYSSNVYELNRLYTMDDTPRNLESMFVSYTLRELNRMGKEWLIVSYADRNMGHSGYIYQATNWLYTGHSASRTDVYVGNGGHSRTYSEEQRKFVIRKLRSVKHRYIYIIGGRKFKRVIMRSLNYPIINEYPKDIPSHYEVGDGVIDVLYHKITKEHFTEDDFLSNPRKYLSESEYDDWIRIYN